MRAIVLTCAVRDEYTLPAYVYPYVYLWQLLRSIAENQVARAEAYYIANTDNQYLVLTSGKPLRGLIQDHVVAGVWMTAQDAFFTREEYFQLLYGALRPEDDPDHQQRLMTLPPTIWKPQPLWTGKQIVRVLSMFGRCWICLTLSSYVTDLHYPEKHHARHL